MPRAGQSRAVHLNKLQLESMKNTAYVTWLEEEKKLPPKKVYQLVDYLTHVFEEYPEDNPVEYLLVILQCIQYFMLKFNVNMDELLDEVAAKKETRLLTALFDDFGRNAGYELESSQLNLERIHKAGMSMRTMENVGMKYRVFSMNGCVQPKIYYEF